MHRRFLANSSGNELHRLLTGGVLTDLKTVGKDFKQFQSQTIRSSLLPHSLRQFTALNGEVVTLTERKTPLALLYAPNQQSFQMLGEWQTAAPNVPFLQVSVNEGPFQKWLEFIYAYNLRKTIPVAEQGKYAIRSGDFAQERAFLGIENRSIPHIFLVDKAGRLRWRACGVCTDRDRSQIKQVADKLLAEKADSAFPVGKPVVRGRAR